ncbi:hypothetical protein NDU88_011605 [Pleurodeles waltl]|uniref:Uncharacterized protein n=1 Tax=Pleurodeles waltl TaxID=8319 RepID=A0AAV7S466_PLEWA|nr:hypothetical protein NDU88_011605 [Pleurodeles waltl]
MRGSSPSAVPPPDQRHTPGLPPLLLKIPAPLSSVESLLNLRSVQASCSEQNRRQRLRVRVMTWRQLHRKKNLMILKSLQMINC